MLDKLQAIKRRWEDVEQQISDPKIISDMKMFKKLNKEYFVEKGFNGCTAVATCIIIEDKNTASVQEVKDSFYDYIRAMCEATKSSSCKA